MDHSALPHRIVNSTHANGMFSDLFLKVDTMCIIEMAMAHCRISQEKVMEGPCSLESLVNMMSEVCNGSGHMSS